MELVCPAGSVLPCCAPRLMQALTRRHIGLKDETNARHFAGLNFNDRQANESLRYAHDRGVRVFMAINTYAQPESIRRWHDAVNLSADLGSMRSLPRTSGFSNTRPTGIPPSTCTCPCRVRPPAARRWSSMPMNSVSSGLYCRECCHCRRSGNWRPTARSTWRCSVLAASAQWLKDGVFFLRHRGIAQHFRRVFPGQRGALGGNG